MTRQVPALAPAHELTLPQAAERTLSNGLTVIALHRPGVPLVELRLRIPFARADLARSAVLPQALLAGTDSMSMVELAAALQTIGGDLGAGSDPDRLMVSGNALVTGLDQLLDILADVLGTATYPAAEVVTERDRVADRIRVARSQPSHLAQVALYRRMYGTHPYAERTPDADAVLAVEPDMLRELHAERVHPAGAVLVLVGDIPAEKALDAAERSLSSWNGGGKDAQLPAVPSLTPGPATLVHRAGSVQSSLRLALEVVPRTHPDHAALQLANLVFGGYFSSRLVENIREDKGYTYSPHAVVEHSVAGSALVVSADVATEVTAPALLETWYELGRMASLPPKDEELEQARRYALGTLHLGVATQAGLAGLVASLAGAGLQLPWLAAHAQRLASVDVAQVAAAASRYLAPARAVTVVLGDADIIADPLSSLTAVTSSDV